MRSLFFFVHACRVTRPGGLVEGGMTLHRDTRHIFDQSNHTIDIGWLAELRAIFLVVSDHNLPAGNRTTVYDTDDDLGDELINLPYLEKILTEYGVVLPAEVKASLVLAQEQSWKL